MFRKITFIFGILLVATCHVTADKAIKKTLSPVLPGKPVYKLNGERVSDNPQLPPDDGRSNWGDLVYKERQGEDELLLRDLVIYPAVSSREQTLKYTAQFNNARSITSARLVNVGRERAYGSEINVYSDGVDVIFTLPAETDPRVLIEVYGYEQ